MTTLFLDPSLYSTPYELHKSLRMLLRLPEYYGMNADALYDCLSERREPLNLWILSSGDVDSIPALSAVRSVVEDLGGTVKIIAPEGGQHS